MWVYVFRDLWYKSLVQKQKKKKWRCDEKSLSIYFPSSYLSFIIILLLNQSHYRGISEKSYLLIPQLTSFYSLSINLRSFNWSPLVKSGFGKGEGPRRLEGKINQWNSVGVSKREMFGQNLQKFLLTFTTGYDNNCWKVNFMPRNQKSVNNLSYSG